MSAFRGWILAIFVCAVALIEGCGGSNSGGGTGGTSGAAGTGGTGATAGTSGGGSGGTSTAGTGGASVAGTGGTSASGTGGTNTAGSGGTGGGAGACTATTSTDPQNCGACGHVCKNATPEFNSYCPPNGCCVSGQCGPSFSQCLSQTDVTNCAAYCASIGETCVEKGCALDGTTWLAWGTQNACNNFHNPPSTLSGAACTANITFTSGANVYARCCCTDTH
jgi:hypothetical protein